MKMRAFVVLMTLAASLLPAVAGAGTLGVIGNGRPELAAISSGAGPTHCTGLMIAPDRILTHRSCGARDDRLAADLSILPGLNMASRAGPAGATPAEREFVTALHDFGPGAAILQTALVEDRAPPAEFFSLETPDTSMRRGEIFDVIHYAGDQGGTQILTQCGVGGDTPGGRLLDCALPATALGAPVLRDGKPVGVISRAGLDRSPRVVPLPDRGAGAVERREIVARPFARIEVVNTCDQDVHQGLLWLDLDGETWKRAARRVPARTAMLLPAATIADSVFSYARSDDGSRVWSGSDIRAEIKGVSLDMARIPVPQPAGDLLLSYSCD